MLIAGPTTPHKPTVNVMKEIACNNSKHKDFFKCRFKLHRYAVWFYMAYDDMTLDLHGTSLFGQEQTL